MKHLIFNGCVRSLWSPVLHLLLYTGPDVVLGLPEDQLRAEDGGDAGCPGDLQRHHPPHALLAARRLQQSALPRGGAGQVPVQRLLVRIKFKALCPRWAEPLRRQRRRGGGFEWRREDVGAEPDSVNASDGQKHACFMAGHISSRWITFKNMSNRQTEKIKCPC